jgi:hypothetical protein
MAQEQRFVVILHVYLDDSGTHDTSKAVAVGGAVSTAEGWEQFEAEWKEALDGWGLSMFHMREFSHKRGQFDNWAWSEESPQRKIRFQRLLDIINDHVIGTVGTTIPTASFERFFSPKAKAHVGGAYGLAATATFMAMGRLAEAAWSSSDPWFAYVVESGTKGFGQIDKVFQLNEQNPQQKAKLRLLSLRFENKRQYLPLQAADVVAYELYQQTPKQLGLVQKPPRLFSLSQLTRKPKDWGYLDDQQMKQWAEIIELSARIAETEGFPHAPLPDDWQFPVAPSPNRATRRSRRRSKHGH